MECGEICTELARLQPDVARLMEDMYNGGHEGVKTQLTILVAQDAERTKIEKRRYQNIMAFLAVLSICVGILSILAGIRSVRTGELRAPSIFSGPPKSISAEELQPPTDDIFNPMTVGEW
jgi:hypothetical protein